MGLLNNALISFVDEELLYIDFEYFHQSQILKKREDGRIVMCIAVIQLRFRYLTGISVYILWTLSLLICRQGMQHLTGVHP